MSSRTVIVTLGLPRGPVPTVGGLARLLPLPGFTYDERREPRMPTVTSDRLYVVVAGQFSGSLKDEMALFRHPSVVHVTSGPVTLDAWPVNPQPGSRGSLNELS
jgi:hypothetical protein